MDIDIMDSLEDLRYPHVLSDEAVQTLLKDGPSCLEFCRLVQWLASELQTLCELESCVNPVSDTEDPTSFLLEVSTFLKELQCPYDCLMNKPISESLVEKSNRIILLDYLCGELFSARIIAATKVLKKQALDVEMESTPIASSLNSISKTLEVDSDDQSNCTALFTAIRSKLENIILTNPEAVKEPVLTEELTESQWTELEKIQDDMLEEYTTRRELLLTRMDVVAQSFKWGENVKGKEEEINKIYRPVRKEMKASPHVKISHLMSCREDVLTLEKTSSASVRKNMQSDLYKVIIPSVPDRGGRPNEQRPPVEMPSWQKRSEPRGGGRGGGFHGRGGGGFRGQGGGGFRGRGGSGHYRGDHRGSSEHYRGDHRGSSEHYRGGSHHRGSAAGAYDAMGSYGKN